MKKFYVSTPIFYPSGNLHIGHVYTMSIANAFVNYKKMQGYSTFFVTGSDEHGQKIEESAQKHNLTPQKYVDQMVVKFKDLWEKLDIKYDKFIRTTDKKHEETVQKIFSILLEKGLIYKGYYEGLYSVSDEEYFTKSQAVFKDGKYYSPVSNHLLKTLKQETYFLKTSSLSSWLKEYFKNNKRFVLPSKIVKELESSFLDNLEDLSITRTNFSWGITVKEDPKHVIYVWFDALINYISALGFIDEEENFKKFWSDDSEILHLVGKEITRFHCIYWPMILKEANLRLPTTIFGHGWIVTPTGKMSKSKNNVVDPLEIIKEYDPEVLIYYLLSQIKLGEDGVFSNELLKLTYNSDLANTLGNLVSRTVAMTIQNFSALPDNNISNDKYDLEIYKLIEESKSDFISFMDKYNLSEALNIAISLAKRLNLFIDQTMPWKEDDKNRLSQIMHVLFNGIYAVNTFLSIVIPKKSKEILHAINQQEISLELILNFDKFNKKTFEKIVNPIFVRKK